MTCAVSLCKLLVSHLAVYLGMTYQTAKQAERAWKRAQAIANDAKYQYETLRQREADIAAEQERLDAKSWAESMFSRS